MPKGVPVFALFTGEMRVTSEPENYVWDRGLIFGVMPKGGPRNMQMESHQVAECNPGAPSCTSSQPMNWTPVVFKSQGVFDEKTDSNGVSEWEFYVDLCKTGVQSGTVCQTMPQTAMKIFVNSETLMNAFQ